MKSIPGSSPHFEAGLDESFPTDLRICCGEQVEIPAGSTGFGYCTGRSFTVAAAQHSVTGVGGLCFSVPGPAEINEFSGFVCSRKEYVGLLSLVALERKGRLRYIDGCSDTLLIAPVMRGDPCLNYLYIPAGTSQQSHTHPSVRVGWVLAGSGLCITPSGTFEMLAGSVFVLDPEGIHSFQTNESSSMEIIVYHPDSDFGPTADDHPMINKTFVLATPLPAALAQR